MNHDELELSAFQYGTCIGPRLFARFILYVGMGK